MSRSTASTTAPTPDITRDQEKNGGAGANPRSVLVLATSATAAAAAQSALDDAGIGPEVAKVENELEPRTRRPVLVVAESADELDDALVVASVDRDFVLLDDVRQALPVRVRLLMERSLRRRERLENAEELRGQTMRLTGAVHKAETREELAATVTEGIRRIFKAHAVSLIIPADPGRGEDSTLAWTTSGRGSSALAATMESLARSHTRHDGRSSVDSRLDDLIVDLRREHDASTVDSLFDADVQHIMLVPITFEDAAAGALLVADSAGAARRTAFERALIAYLGVQVGRATSELWLYDRQLASEEELHRTSAELREFVSQMDDLGVVIRSIADTVNVGVIFYDNENHPKLRNGMVERLLALAGFDPETGLSTHVYGSDRRTRVKQGKNIVSETLEGDQRGLIYWMGDPEGEQRAVVTEAHTIVKPTGEQLGSAIVTYDVTDLANAIEIREEYLATVSHELRTPLTSIVGYLDLIDDGFDVEELGFGKEFRVIQRSAEQMLALIRDLLSTSTQELSLHVEPVDVSSLLKLSVSTLRPVFEAAHQTLRLEEPATTVLAHLDAARIRQVVDNLISNGSKYTPDGGEITVGLERDDDTVVITVADTGRGISKADQARLFDRFFRARDAREDAIQGVGLGLTIVKTIVEAHDGTISVQSEPGHGSTFTVRLPMRAEGSPLPTLPMEP
ncbi:hypothetical protein GCM10027568_21630 [Humibacter soli]